MEREGERDKGWNREQEEIVEGREGGRDKGWNREQEEIVEGRER